MKRVVSFIGLTGVVLGMMAAEKSYAMSSPAVVAHSEMDRIENPAWIEQAVIYQKPESPGYVKNYLWQHFNRETNKYFVLTAFRDHIIKVTKTPLENSYKMVMNNITSHENVRPMAASTIRMPEISSILLLGIGVIWLLNRRSQLKI